MISNLINSVFGSRSDREIKLLYPIVDEINQLAEKLKNKSDEELKQRTIELMDDIQSSREEAEPTVRAPWLRRIAPHPGWRGSYWG